MMAYKFSAKTNSFYPAAMLEDYRQAGTLPDDLIDTDEEEYRTYTATPPVGKVRGANEHGAPAWVIPPPPTQEQLEMAALLEKNRRTEEAEAYIAPLARAEKYDIATPEERGLLVSWEKYSVQLSRIKPEAAPDIDWPQPPQ
ncbi:tail fiber assembly protein [Serratia ureilytica]|uniref:tail fiber assembly protein n=1 Tax=Serratia ureilytica TaxID=300181 RepID=UPI00069B3B18